ncbi:hypothetical protein ES703_67309 [subsurface metagenome]
MFLSDFLYFFYQARTPSIMDGNDSLRFAADFVQHIFRVQSVGCFLNVSEDRFSPNKERGVCCSNEGERRNNNLVTLPDVVSKKNGVQGGSA